MFLNKRFWAIWLDFYKYFFIFINILFFNYILKNNYWPLVGIFESPIVDEINKKLLFKTKNYCYL